MSGKVLRAKDALREYLRFEKMSGEYADEVVPALFSFVFWLEGQDLEADESPCRYHLVPAADSPCPFEFDQLESNPGRGL